MHGAIRFEHTFLIKQALHLGPRVGDAANQYPALMIRQEYEWRGNHSILFLNEA